MGPVLRPDVGDQKDITHPIPGDADYATSGGTDCPTTPAAGYYSYFGSRAGDPSKGYYSYNLGSWHIIALNTAQCPTDSSTCDPGSPQDLWLQQDLAANTASCTLAYYQNPRFVSTTTGGDTTYQQIWQDLYAGGVDAVMNGDAHWYERFKPLNSAGTSNATFGIREFIVGTGGQGLDDPGPQAATSEVVNNTTHGVMRMTLKSGSFGWQFVPDEGTFTDSGTATCHGKPPTTDTVAPTTTIKCNAGACGTVPTKPAQVSLAAIDNVGGAGADKTYFTTDGSTPTTASTAYTAPFTLSSTATVKFFSVDKAGNAEAVSSKQILIDAAAPTIAITQPAGGSSFSRGSTMTMVASATDLGTSPGAPSGIAKVDFFDGATKLNTDTVVPYQYGWFTLLAAGGTHTLTAVATDAAGNTTTSASITVTIR